jgi:hypothetical protein
MELVERSAKGSGDHVVPGSFGSQSILPLKYSSSDNSSAFLHGMEQPMANAAFG